MIMQNRLDPNRSLWDVIAVQVRSYRLHHNLTGDQLAEILKCKRSQVSRIENGLRRLNADYAAILDSTWKTEGLFSFLVRHASARSTDEGWLTGLQELERDASRIRMWESCRMPGLLQTPDYARAQLRMGLGNADEVEAALKVRLARAAAVFDRSTPAIVTAVLSWAVLVQPVGGQGVMREQLAHLLALGERPNFTVRIVEASAGIHMGHDGPVKLLTVDNRDVGFTEASTGGRLLLDPADVQLIAVRYEQVSDLAASRGRSRELLIEAMEHHP
ncbi:helix-turn-helix domain-containing protein [Spirillospora sp. NPDC050679]